MSLRYLRAPGSTMCGLLCSVRTQPPTFTRFVATSSVRRSSSKANVDILTSDGRDFYDVLGISPDATQTEIREAFYRCLESKFLII